MERQGGFFFTNNPDQYYNQSNKDNYLEYNFAILAFSIIIIFVEVI